LEACSRAGKNPIHKKIVDQITAVDNFVAFKKLMCKRNAELNKQAMALLEQQPKPSEDKPKEEPVAPQDKPAEPKPTDGKPGDPKVNMPNFPDDETRKAWELVQKLEREEELSLMKKALEESKKMEDRQKIEMEEEEEMIRKAIEESKKEAEDVKEKETKEVEDV